MKNALVEFLLKLFGLGDKSMVEKLIRSVLLGGGGGKAVVATASDEDESAPAADGGNPLEKLMNQFKDKGLGKIFQSWVGTGPNEAVTAEQIKHGVGDEKMGELAQKAGLPVDVLAGKLSKYLPGLIDKMTPGGKLPGK